MNQFRTISQNWINEAIEKNKLQNKEQLLALREEMIGALDEIFNQLPISQDQSPTEHKLDYIKSDRVTVEIVDQQTAFIYRRKLEINYVENDNALKLTGENFDGHPSEIVFLSSKSLTKINDLMGKGLNHSRCHD